MLDNVIVLQALLQKVGDRVDATVGRLIDYGALLKYEVEVDADYKCEAWGLMHRNKMGHLDFESLQVLLLVAPASSCCTPAH